jgi:hypothetical protein
MFSIIGKESESRWLYIKGYCDYWDYPNDFIELLNAYAEKLKSKVIAVSEYMQFSVQNDPLNLIFQWDTCFGITIDVPLKTDMNTAKNELNLLFEYIENSKT